MASFTKKRVTFTGDNINTLMKPPCRTLEYDKDAPVSQLRNPVVKSPGRKHENARLRRIHQECIDIIQAIQEKRGIPKDQRCLKFTIHFA